VVVALLWCKGRRLCLTSQKSEDHDCIASNNGTRNSLLPSRPIIFDKRLKRWLKHSTKKVDQQSVLNVLCF
jgi:hypothetical protein